MASGIEQVVRCPRCRVAVPRGSQFCHKCGASIRGAGVAVLRRPALVSILAVLDALAFLVYAFLLAEFMAVPSFRAVIPYRGTFLMFLGGTILSGLAAFGLWRLRPFGRTVQVGMAWLGLLAFPVGTFFSILLLVYFYKPGAKVLFSGRKPWELTQAEAQELKRSGEGRGVLAVFASTFVLVTAIVGIFVVVPNLTSAIQRARQKRTVYDIQRIATAIGSFSAKHRQYPDTSSIAELKQFLQSIDPGLPTTDGWGREFRYRGSPHDYYLASAARDGRWQFEDMTSYPEGRTSTFDDDIVCHNGVFVQAPAQSWRLDQKPTPSPATRSPSS